MIYLVFPLAHFVSRVAVTVGSADSEHLVFSWSMQPCVVNSCWQHPASPTTHNSLSWIRRHYVGFEKNYVYLGVSLNGGTPKSSILIGFSMINHPFWDTLFMETSICWNVIDVLVLHPLRRISRSDLIKSRWNGDFNGLVFPGWSSRNSRGPFI